MSGAADLTGVTIAFDLDGTLFDPGGAAYREATRALLAERDHGLDESAAWDAYETLRRMGRGLERLGLPNPNHHRTHPKTLAALFVLFADGSRLRAVGGVSPLVREVMRESLARFDEALPARDEADWRERLSRERRVRALLRGDVSLAMLRETAARAASSPAIAEWAAKAERIESSAKPLDPSPLLDALQQRGANLVVISEGLADVQRGKLARLGLERRFDGRALITEDAGTVDGLPELDAAIEPLLDRADDADAPTDDERIALWRVRCAASLWATKSRWFYGRCLHAIRADAADPAQSLRSLAVMPRDDWSREPLRFVMIGDRHDRDIAPVQLAAGPANCLTLRLAAGRYAGEFDPAALPFDRRPTRTFTSWDSLAEYLVNELSPDAVPTLKTPPAIAPESLCGADFLRTAEHAPLESVRRIARALRLAGR